MLGAWFRSRRAEMDSRVDLLRSTCRRHRGQLGNWTRTENIGVLLDRPHMLGACVNGKVGELEGSGGAGRWDRLPTNIAG